MWTEELVIEPLYVDENLVGRRGALGRAASAKDVSTAGGTNHQGTFLVHARFQLKLDEGRNGPVFDDSSSPSSSPSSSSARSSSSPTTLSSALTPVAVEALLRQSNLSNFDVTYTRGNLGTYRLPAWYVQRGAGLVVQMDPLARSGSSSGGGQGYRATLATMSRMLGASASSMMDSKSYVEREEGFRGFLTQDFPCVESVARWLRLLPCGGQAGVSGVLQNLGLLELPYHSVRVVVEGERAGSIERTERREKSGQVLTIEVTGVVHDARPSEVEMMISRNNRVNAAREGTPEGVLGGLVERRTVCPVVATSVVRADGCTEETPSMDTLVVMSVSNKIRRREGEAGNPLVGTVESAIRLGDADLNKGDENVSLRYSQMIPWEVVVDSRSLKVERGGVTLDSNSSSVRWVNAVGRGHAGMLEVDIEVAVGRGSRGDIIIGFDVERPVLSVFDYPADMSRGVDIPAPQVTVIQRGLTASMGSACVPSINNAVGQNVLFQLPIPDASMPFNVACFTTTLLSILFGAMMPVLLWEKDELRKVQSAKYAIKARLKRLGIALAVAGVTLFYLDLATRALIIDVYETALKTLKIM